MSDISKKIFSIEPEPDEDPIALVPEIVEAVDVEAVEIKPTDTDKSSLLRSVSGSAVSSHRPIFELVEVFKDDESDDEDAPFYLDADDVVADREDDAALKDEPNAIDTLEDVNLLDIEETEAPSFLQHDTPADEAIISPIAERAHVPIPKAPDSVAAASIVPAGQPSLAPSAAYEAPSDTSGLRLGWVGPVLAVLTGLAIGALVYAYIMDAGAITPIGLAGLILAVIVPMVSVIALWATLRALSASRAETLRLAAVADRLTRVDDAVTTDVARMSSAIRRELAQVDSRLAQSRDEIETLAALITRQATELGSMTQRLADRSETVANTAAQQREAFAGLSSDFDTRMTALTHNIDTQRGALDSAATAAAKRVGEASEALDHATKLTAGHGDAISAAAVNANTSVTEAEARLGALSDRIKTQAEELDAFYERRTAQLTDLSDRLSNEKGLAETALYTQTEKLGAVDAQLEITESRLTALLDHAGAVQAQLTARLSDIDSTLSDADQRSRAFTADIADRVSDSVAQTRREISIMEGELRALQSRMDGAKSADVPLEPPVKTDTAPTRVHLKPLDTDFPSLDEDDLVIPEAQDDDTLELTTPIKDDTSPLALTAMPPETDVVRRPGEKSGLTFGREKSEKPEKNWRWRDMLGSIDTVPETAPLASPPPKAAPLVQRPGPGVPLSMPEKTAPQPEGSDVVARLCEVKLPPSSVVDDAVIAAAEAARKSGGEAAQSEAVFSRLKSPVIHLRGVLSADLEFRLRAEGFRRSYHGYLSDLGDPSRLRTELSSANGRAYLLCAAALSAS